uniref:Cytochrome b5 reductase 4 n=1 Tax=Gadus morhua TaxID=8049 RepID=A0A8C5BC73_GADMO
MCRGRLLHIRLFQASSHLWDCHHFPMLYTNRPNYDDTDSDDEEEEDEREERWNYVSSAAHSFTYIMTDIFRRLGSFRIVKMLNVPTQSFPAAGSQQRVAPAGQSGRNKVALKPGHSLMDWIRFAKSGRDHTGLRGRLIEVTEEELKKHGRRDDCWTCIRGMVYNVTPYMDYHPGGEEELMKAAGKDGTELFDQVHRWVNYESMLKECLVGRMAVKPLAVKGLTPPLPPPPLMASPTSPSSMMLRPTGFAPPSEKDSRPRFDWFQTDSTVNIVVYTKRKIPRSGCATIDLQGGVLRLEALLGNMSYMLHLRLTEEVEGSVEVQTAGSVGKIQLSIPKQAKGKWASVGQPLEFHNSFLRQKDRALHYRDCVLVSKTEVNHNTSVFRLQLGCGSVMHVPVGKHVYLKTQVQDAEVVKPYTPVEQSLIPVVPVDPVDPVDPVVPVDPVDPASQDQTHGSDLFLMIKVYPDGLFTPQLDTLHIGDHLMVSGPEGPFSLRPLRDVTHLYLLAAGTGFTPMARLIQLSLQDLGSIKSTKLLLFNRQEKDITWRSQMDELAATDQRCPKFVRCRLVFTYVFGFFPHLDFYCCLFLFFLPCVKTERKKCCRDAHSAHCLHSTLSGVGSCSTPLASRGQLWLPFHSCGCAVSPSPRFQVEYVLSEPGDGWPGQKGRVEQSMLRDFLSRPEGSRVYVCVCGPSAFTELTEE